jgi:hypothetical protein
VETQDTASKLSRTRGLIPFKKGGDPRRNTRGRPKNFDELRRLSQRIGAEETTDSKGNVMTRIELVLRRLADSSDPHALRIFLEYGFGRPVDRVEVDGLRPKTTLRLFFAHEELGFDKKLGDTGVVGRNLPYNNGQNMELEPESPPTLLS